MDVTTKRQDGSLDLGMIIDETRVAIADGADVICEAAFSYDENYCAVDILRRKGDGWDIYEVKSSTYSTEEKDIGERLTKYAWDIAYQKWVLEHCGLKVTGTLLGAVEFQLCPSRRP